MGLFSRGYGTCTYDQSLIKHMQKLVINERLGDTQILFVQVSQQDCLAALYEAIGKL